MKPNLILLPTNEFIQNIFNLRKQIVEIGLGENDPRINVLPHSTILYIEEDLTKEQINKIIQQLDKLQIHKPIVLGISKITNWKHKVIAMLDTSPLENLKNEIETLLNKTNIKFNNEYKKDYGDTIGNHIKLARQIYPNKIKEAINMFQKNLIKEISFERIAFIDYETEEKDILWEKRLSK